MTNFRKFIEIFLLVSLMISSVTLAIVMMDSTEFLPVKSKIKAINNVAEFPLGGVQGEAIIIQTFKQHEEISKIGVKFATYDRENPGEIYVRVYNTGTQVEYLVTSISAANLVDNNFYEFTLDQIIPADNQEYAIEISGTSPNPSESVGIWSSYSDQYPDGYLKVSEFKTEGDLLFYLSGTDNNKIFGKISLSILMSVILLAIIAIWLNLDKLLTPAVRGKQP